MKLLKCIILLFVICVSFKADAWYKLDGFPEIGYSVKGYSIEGQLSQYAELSIFPKINKFGIIFYADNKAYTKNRARIAISICGKIEEGITEHSQILPSTNWSIDFLKCNQPIYVSIKTTDTTTIYRFPNHDY